MTHAMILTAVDMKGGLSRKWRIENMDILEIYIKLHNGRTLKAIRKGGKKDIFKVQLIRG